MDTRQRSTVVGVFEDRVHADRAVSHLLNAGFRQDQIGVAHATRLRFERGKNHG